MESRDDVAAKLINVDPLPSIQLASIEPDAVHIRSQVAATEYVEKLVAFSFTRRPVMHEQPRRRPVQAEFFPQLAAARRGRRFTAIHISARNVPAISVGLPYQQNSLSIHEQRPRRTARRRERLKHVDHG